MASNGKHADPTPRIRRKRVAKLENVGAVLTEMARLYREARRGELEAGDASKLNSILVAMRQGYEASTQIAELMAMVESLRAQVDEGNKPGAGMPSRGAPMRLAS